LPFYYAQEVSTIEQFFLGGIAVKDFTFALKVVIAIALVLLLADWGHAQDQGGQTQKAKGANAQIRKNARQMIEEGRHTFRFDTFGDEDFWGGTLKLHQAISGAAQGGVGPGLSPTAALALGLKVDVTALSSSLRNQLKHSEVNLDDPAATLALLKLNAVVGVTGFFDGDTLTSFGIQ
jgi:hypothetical protein